MGAFSGAANVCVNSLAVRAEQASGKPVIARAHGLFSLSLVAAILASVIGLTPVPAFALLTFAAMVYALLAPRTLSPEARGRMSARPRAASARVFLLIGGLGALAFMLESSHQAWTAIYLQQRLGLPRTSALLGPAAFYLVVALARVALGLLPQRHPTRVVALGAAAGAAGTTLVALAVDLPSALIGVVVAAAGTAVLFPTLLSIAAEQTGSASSGFATSRVTAISYLGFLGGPVYVGFWSAAFDLQLAFVAVACLGLFLALLARWPLRAYTFSAPG